MARLLFILGLFLLVWLAFRYFRVKFKQLKHHQQEQAHIHNVKPCAYCGTHIPEQDALLKNEKYFCSDEHWQQYLEKNK